MLNTDYIDIASVVPGNKTLIRPHQSEAVETLQKYFDLGKNIPNRKGILVMPTGSGKTYTAVNWLLNDAVTKGYAVVWIVHRQELVQQTYTEFVDQAPLLKGSSVKKYRVIAVSGLEGHSKMPEAHGQNVYVLSRQSAGNDNGIRFFPNMLKGKSKVIVVIDEAHHAISSQYMKIWNEIHRLRPNAALLGLTATPTRKADEEKARLNKFFHVNENIKKHIGINGYVHQVTLNELIKSGFLSKPRYIPKETNINVEHEFKFTDDDRIYLQKNEDLTPELEKQFAESTIRNKAIVDEYFDHQGRPDYGKTLIFAVNKLHAEILCKLFNERQKGIAEYVVSGKPGTHEIIQDYKNNKFKILINVQILTEGNDVPDIQTVFLTRATSSDVVLMQMIGRALRGEAAGGTKTANIVAFHDVWERYKFWMDPKDLDVFEDLDDEFEDLEDEEELPEIVRRDFEEEELIIRAPQGLIEENPWKELYLRYYHALSLNGTLFVPAKDRIPVGWYQVSLPDGTSKSILIYNDQQAAFKNVGKNINSILKEFKGTLTFDVLGKFNEKYFPNHKLSGSDAFNLLRHIIKNRNMPSFFSFDDIEGFEPHALGAYLRDNFPDQDSREYWLEKTWKTNPVLHYIYKLFINFKITALNAMKNKVSSKIVTKQDPKEEYQIVDNYYDLNDCLQEVLKQYPKLTAEGLIRIQWSEKIPLSWYAYVQMAKDKKHFQITINRRFSSPLVNREVVKYLIFHELLHQNGYWEHDKDFRSREWQYPNSANWDAFMDGVINYVYDYTKYKDLFVPNEFPPVPEWFCSENVDEQKTIENTLITANNQKDEIVVTKAIDFTKTISREIKTCPVCGSKLPENAKFCMECGTKLV